MQSENKVLVLGDDVNTDDIIPAHTGTTTDPEFLKMYALEYILGPGNLIGYESIEAGNNFGCGSSREHAPIAIQAAGVKTVRAASFAELFYRNSVNIGLNVELKDQVETDPIIQLIIASGGLTPFNQKRIKGELSLPHVQTLPRPMTMAEKILARSSGHDFVQPGNVIFLKVDVAMAHEVYVAAVAKKFYEIFGSEAKVWDPGRVVLVVDHFVQVTDLRPDPKAQLLQDELVKFAHAQGCHLFDTVAPGEATGICHILMPEKGFTRPGTLIVGTDSHCTSYGAFGCFALGVGITDMANIFATGEAWIRVPPTLLFELTGTLPEHISAKDIILFILSQIGCSGARGYVMEFRGEILEQLSIDERITLTNMTTECGAIFGIMPVDEKVCGYVRQRSSEPFEVVVSDPDAIYEKVFKFDLTHLQPQVACPPQPDQVVAASTLEGTRITRAFIGSCTGGKLDDLAAAAAVLKGRKVAPNVSFCIVPGSQEVRQEAERLGFVDIYQAAGAQFLKTACGACCNAGLGALGPEDIGISAINRNFKGRSGHPDAIHYLASPRVVAISAVKGFISADLDSL